MKVFPFVKVWTTVTYFVIELKNIATACISDMRELHGTRKKIMINAFHTRTWKFDPLGIDNTAKSSFKLSILWSSIIRHILLSENMSESKVVLSGRRFFFSVYQCPRRLCLRRRRDIKHGISICTRSFGLGSQSRFMSENWLDARNVTVPRNSSSSTNSLCGVRCQALCFAEVVANWRCVYQKRPEILALFWFRNTVTTPDNTRGHTSSNCSDNVPDLEIIMSSVLFNYFTKLSS